MSDFYQSNKNWEKVFERIQANKEISKANKETAKEFLKYLQARDVSAGRLKKYMEKYKRICRMSKKDISKLTYDDIPDIQIEINKIRRSYTMKDYNVTLKMLLRCIWKEKFNPEHFKGMMKTNFRIESELNLEASQLPTEEEIQLLLKHANAMYKAAISLQYEVGMRPSELLTLTVGSVTFDKGFSNVHIRESKTVRRMNLAIKSDEYLRAWINQHPKRENPNAPLWISFYYGKENLGFLSPPGYAKGLSVLAKQAGIKKHIWPYLLRHAAITRMLRESWTIPMIQQTVGHSIGSRTIKKYAHLSNEEVKSYTLEKSIEVEKKAIVDNKDIGYVRCNKCETMNKTENLFCRECNRPIDPKAIMEQEQKNKQFDEFMMDFVKLAISKDNKLSHEALELAKARKMTWLFEKKID